LSSVRPIWLERRLQKTRVEGEMMMEAVAPADERIDVSNNSHPLSILKAQWTLKQLGEGKVLEVLCGDGQTKGDLLRIIQKSPNHKVVGLWEEAGSCRILISRLKKS
jgi:TusA-related sulfurtransferase